MESLQQSWTFFHRYQSRLRALATKHHLETATLRELFENSFGSCGADPLQSDSRQTLMKLAQLKIGLREINWLLQAYRTNRKRLLATQLRDRR